MCGHCGCAANRPNIDVVTQGDNWDLKPDDGEHSLDESSGKLLQLHQNILAKNDRYAAFNRELFRHLLAINILSSPGSGKTTLIQRLMQDRHLILGADLLHPGSPALHAGVIVGDLAGDRDAQRLQQTGLPTVQITTGNLCHLEADSVAKAAQSLDLESLNLLIIENVGNLVCPAAYDLGEDLRIVLMSVTEGEDKPLKYPTMFKSADIVILSKMDLVDAVGFSREEALTYLQQVAPQAKVFEVSAVTGQGLGAFYSYLTPTILQCLRSSQDTPIMR